MFIRSWFKHTLFRRKSAGRGIERDIALSGIYLQMGGRKHF